MANADQTDITAITNTITTLQNLTATDNQNAKDIADVVIGYTNEKNRRAGSLCAVPTSTAYGMFGGSAIAQVNVGARQW